MFANPSAKILAYLSMYFLFFSSSLSLLMICARELEKYLSKIRREREEEKKRKYVLKYATIFAEGLANITNRPKEEIEKKIMELLS